MLIKLTNFKCYTNKEYDIPDKGIVLFSGPSGAGKSTIFQSILFCLFNYGTKLITYEEKSCTVEITMNNIYVKRTKRPNRLEVIKKDNEKNSTKYYDDAAQTVINTTFNNENISLFKNTSYMDQNIYTSFILLSPLEKLSFMEKFAFKDINLMDVKKKLKELISQRNTDIISNQSKLDTLRNILDSIIIPECINFPIKCKESSIPKAIKNEETKQKNYSIIIKKKTRTLDTIKELYSNALVLHNKSITYEEELTNTKTDLESLDKGKIPYIGDEEMEILNLKLLQIINSKKITNLMIKHDELTERLEEVKSQENDEKTEKLQELNRKMKPQEYINDLKEDIKDLNNQLKMHQEYSALCKKLDKGLENKETELDLELELEKMKKELNELKLLENTYKCPRCNCILKISGKKAIEIETVISNDDGNIHAKISKLEKDIDKTTEQYHIHKQLIKRKGEIEGEINVSEEQYVEKISYEKMCELEELKDIQNEINELKNKPYSSTVKYIQKDIDMYIDSLNQCDMSNYIEDIDETEEKILKDKIDTEKLNKNLYIQWKERYDDINNKIIRYELKLKNVHKYLNDIYEELQVKTIKDIELSIKEKEKDLKELYDKKEDNTKILEVIEKYKEYTKEKNKYDKLLEDIKTTEKCIQTCIKKYEATLKFKEKLLQSESEAIFTVMETVNIHANNYLEKFFPNDVMSVYIKPYKGEKPQINVYIEYKGMECDLTTLSGGELSRVVLAFTLALGEMFNTPMFLLDECTSSLDQDTINTIFNSIKDNFVDKLILIIAHQVVEGDYDCVIKVK